MSLSPGVTPTTFTLTVTGTVGTLSHSATANVTVKADPTGVGNVIGLLTLAGCLDNSGISNALISKVRSAQAAISAGDIRTAVNTLSALVNQISAQGGKHISTSCTSGGITFNPVTVLTDDIQTLLAVLRANPDPLVGRVVSPTGVDVPGAVVTIYDLSHNVVASAMTDLTGFYFFATTGILNAGNIYTVAITGIPAPYTSSSPAQTITWLAVPTTINFVLN